jgi:putative ABC transport system permease protein
MPSDGPAAPPVAVVNQAFAEKYFPGKDPIGRRIRQGDQKSTQSWMTIVGVVPTTFTGDPDLPRDPAYFVPLAQHHSNFVSIAVATTGMPVAITSSVRRAIASLNPDIPLYRVFPMDEAVARGLWHIRVFGTMFMAFGVIALFLASVGLYAVMSFSVSRRTREVGIRMALGARGGDVVRMIFRQGAWQLIAGMAIGLAIAAGLAQLMSVVLYDVQPRDPMIFAGVAAVLTAAGLAACLVPARRATRIDPLSALRSE